MLSTEVSTVFSHGSKLKIGCGFDSRRRHILLELLSSYLFFFISAHSSTYFFILTTPRLRLANANLRPGSGIPPGLTLYYHF